MQTLAAIYAFVVAHGPAVAGYALLVLPTLITGLSKYPQDANFVSVLKVLLSMLSFLTHKDSPGTFKLPLTFPLHPDDSPTTFIGGSGPKGFVRFPVLLGLILAALALAATPAFAQSAPPEPLPQRLVGGCNAKGSICFGPSIAVTMSAYDLTHKQVVAGFNPGVGYGVTFNQGKWDAFGLDFYVSLQSGVDSAITIASMAKVANGYIRFGIARQIIAGRGATLVPVGLGLDF